MRRQWMNDISLDGTVFIRVGLVLMEVTEKGGRKGGRTVYQIHTENKFEGRVLRDEYDYMVDAEAKFDELVHVGVKVLPVNTDWKLENE